MSDSAGLGPLGEDASAAALAIGVDVGGTKTLAGVVDRGGRILATERVATPARDVAASIDAIVTVVNRLREVVRVDHGDAPVAGVGIGVAALVDAGRSRVVFAPNLGWPAVLLGEEVTDRTGLPVVVENDANAAAWGEFRHGAGVDMRDVVVVTVGTGVGGGLILSGRLRRGVHGMSAEIGHMSVVADGRLCGCGRRGCWEQYASGSALVRVTRELAGERREEAAILLGLGDGTPEGIRGRHITEAAQRGDEVAQAAFAEVGRWLGRGLADLTAVLDPQAYIIGGGVSDAGELLVGPARREHEDLVTRYGDRVAPPLVIAQLGNDAGVVGAAGLARSEGKSQP
jgi:glucokinase